MKILMTDIQVIVLAIKAKVITLKALKNIKLLPLSTYNVEFKLTLHNLNFYFSIL